EDPSEERPAAEKVLQDLRAQALAEGNQQIAQAIQDFMSDSSDEENNECCDDCAAEWIPILVDDCMKMWTLLWELGSYKEAAHLADEAWRLDPCNIATMHARTLSHIALALNVKPAADCQAQPANAFRDLASVNTTWQVTNMGFGGFAISCSGPT